MNSRARYPRYSAPPAPSPDAAAAPYTYTRAAVRRRPDDPEPRSYPPSQSPHESADRKPAPQRQSAARQFSAAHPETAGRSAPPRCGNRSALPPAFNASSKLSRIGRKFLMTSAAANSRNSCCSRAARLRALSNSACRRARRSSSASRSALSFSVSDSRASRVCASLAATAADASSSPPSAAGSSCSRSSAPTRSAVRFFRFLYPYRSYSDSFKSLSNSRAMYDTADIVC